MSILSPRLFLLAFLFPGNFLPAAELQWQPETGYRWAELSTPHSPLPTQQRPGFTVLSPAQTGLTFTNRLDEHAIAVNRVLANGSGLATGDIFHDGLPAIFFCGLNGHCALYKNLGGYKFSDITAASGIVTSNLICRGAVFADINGDGWPDLLVSASGNGVLVFTNRHDGTFADISASAGLLSPYGAGTLALADVDGNGTLDLYVANYRKESVRDRADLQLNSINGKLSIPPALRDRLTLIPIPLTLSHQDIHRLTPLLQEALPAILAWAIQGAMLWLIQGLSEPDQVTSANASFRHLEDDLSPFLESACTLDPARFIRANELYQAYHLWSRAHHYRYLTPTAFGRLLQARLTFYRTRTSLGRFYHGLSLTLSLDQLAAQLKPFLSSSSPPSTIPSP